MLEEIRTVLEKVMENKIDLDSTVDVEIVNLIAALHSAIVSKA